jgi:hypothetical protein
MATPIDARKRLGEAEDDSRSARRRSVNPRRCICGNTECGEINDAFEEIAPDRGGYVLLPAEPKLGTAGYEKRKHMLSGILRHLGMAAKYAAGESGSCFSAAGEPKERGSTQLFFSKIHLSPRITALTAGTEITRILNLDISLATGEEIGFTQIDLRPQVKGEPRVFAPFPNRTINDARAELSALRARSSSDPAVQKRRASRDALVADVDVHACRRLHEGDTLRAQLEELKAQRAVDLEQLEHQAQELKRLKSLDGFVLSGGLCRSNLIDDVWHEKNPTAAKILFGFEDWSETKVYITEAFWPEMEIPCASAVQRHAPMTEFEKCLITKMRFQKRFDESILGYMWGRDRSRIHRYIHEWAPRWGRIGRILSHLDIDDGYLAAEMPAEYLSQGLGKVGALVDGKDFMTETVRSNAAFTRACWSDKVQCSAARCITWTTPSGLCFEHTPLYAARATETSLVKLWSATLSKIPLGRVVLADRGFYRDAILYPNFNAQLTPHFLSGREQFSAGEIISDRRICQLRYTAETSFSRVTDTAGLQDVISRNFFTVLQDMCDWGHAHMNLCKPLKTPSHVSVDYFLS